MRLDKTEGGWDIKRELYNVKPFVEILQQINHMKVSLIQALSVQRKLHGKNQIAIPEDKHDSSSLQAKLWRYDELFSISTGITTLPHQK